MYNIAKIIGIFVTMMEGVVRVSGDSSMALAGKVVLDFPKAFWNFGMIMTALVMAPFTFSFELLVTSIVLTYFSLLVGHSVGMHRMMIHRTFISPKWFERFLIYIGVLVGMSGPFGIIKIHDLRDWAQRQ